MLVLHGIGVGLDSWEAPVAGPADRGSAFMARVIGVVQKHEVKTIAERATYRQEVDGS